MLVRQEFHAGSRVFHSHMLYDNCVAINLQHGTRMPSDGTLHRPLGAIEVNNNDDWSLTKKLLELWDNTELVPHSNADISKEYDQVQYDFTKNFPNENEIFVFPHCVSHRRN